MSQEFEKAYLFTGVNGVGKTTLLKGVCENQPEVFHLFPGSTRFMERLGLQPGDYESLRKLPEDFKVKEFDDLMVETLRQKKPGARSVLLVDAHLYNYKQGQMVASSTDWLGGLDSIFLVSTDASSLLARMGKDAKSRDILPSGLGQRKQVEMLTYFLDATERKAREIAGQYGIPFYVIQNQENGMETAIQDFLKIHKEFAS